MSSYKEYLEDYKRIVSGKSSMWDKVNPFEEASMDNIVGNYSPTMNAQALAQDKNKLGAADLTPMKNKAQEAQAGLEDAMDAIEAGKIDDARQALMRAKAAIEQALGGLPPA